MSKGKVYLVGAGPGDAELITLKGYQLICQADVILYDHLVSSELLEFAKPNAEVISVGKYASCHPLPQAKINELLVKKAAGNKVVVRLKGGDPYLFGRGGEEAEACVEANVDFEVVPGITSAFAVPCYAGIPPTHRDYTSNVAIVTGHRKDEQQLEIPKAGTVIFLMGVANIKKIVHSLIETGWAIDTKIAAIENGTFYNQKVITGTLENIVEKIKKQNLKTPAIFVVGRVVELQEKLNWFSKKPTVLVLGNHPEKYKHLGTIVHRRIIDCVATEDNPKSGAVLRNAGTFDWIIFTSANGVKFFFQGLHGFGADARMLASTKIAAIGQTTGKRLFEYGIRPDIVPENESSAGLLKEFEKLDIKGKKVLLPQSEIASKELAEGLLKEGAIVEKVTLYKTLDVDPGNVDFNLIDQILFTSGSTVRAFVKKFGKVPSNVKAYALGLPTQAVAREHNIDAKVLK